MASAALQFRTEQTQTFLVVRGPASKSLCDMTTFVFGTSGENSTLSLTRTRFCIFGQLSKVSQIGMVYYKPGRRR